MFETETVGLFLARKIKLWGGGERDYPPDLYTAKIRSSEFGCLRDKMVKNFFIFTNLRWKKMYVVLLLPFFVLLVCISYYLQNFVSLLIKFF